MQQNVMEFNVEARLKLGASVLLGYSCACLHYRGDPSAIQIREVKLRWRFKL